MSSNKLYQIALTLGMIVCMTSYSFANMVFIGLMQDKKIESLKITPGSGSFEILANGKHLMNLDQQEEIVLLTYKNELKLIASDTLISQSFVLKMQAKDANSLIGLQIMNSDGKQLQYEGDLLITSNNNRLRVINIINVEKYLKGVIKAEVGMMDEPEFLKAMAVVSRTYTFKNMYRHGSEGFDLCDATHCQVYVGEDEIYENIRKGIASTTGQVVFDRQWNLIHSVFHSNSGGILNSSEYAWNGNYHYLKTKSDPYSSSGRNYRWKKSIPQSEWKSYLSEKTGQTVNTYKCTESMERGKYYYCGTSKVPVKEIRTDWGLRSTMFTMKNEGNEVILTGAGYGHGVGMSQEGAFKMAKLGKLYEDIIKFYYSGVEINDYKTWNSLVNTRKL